MRRKNRETKYIKESYEKACEEYGIVGNVEFNLKKYSELQRENKEGKSMGNYDNYKKLTFFILGVLLGLRVWFEFTMSKNISNETMGFAIIIAVMFFFF